MVIKTKCKQCGYEWIQRAERPIKCPNISCQSHFWDVENPKAKGESAELKQTLSRPQEESE